MRKSGSIILLGISLIVFSACEKIDPEPATDIFEIQGENGFIGMVDGTSNTFQIKKKSYPVFRFSLTAPSPAGPIPIPYPHLEF